MSYIHITLQLKYTTWVISVFDWNQSLFSIISAVTHNLHSAMKMINSPCYCIMNCPLHNVFKSSTNENSPECRELKMWQMCKNTWYSGWVKTESGMKRQIKRTVIFVSSLYIFKKPLGVGTSGMIRMGRNPNLFKRHNFEEDRTLSLSHSKCWNSGIYISLLSSK